MSADNLINALARHPSEFIQDNTYLGTFYPESIFAHWYISDDDLIEPFVQ